MPHPELCISGALFSQFLRPCFHFPHQFLISGYHKKQKSEQGLNFVLKPCVWYRAEYKIFVALPCPEVNTSSLNGVLYALCEIKYQLLELSFKFFNTAIQY